MIQLLTTKPIMLIIMRGILILRIEIEERFATPAAIYKIPKRLKLLYRVLYRKPIFL